jgi:hypothetical protein
MFLTVELSFNAASSSWTICSPAHMPAPRRIGRRNLPVQRQFRYPSVISLTPHRGQEPYVVAHDEVVGLAWGCGVDGGGGL